MGALAGSISLGIVCFLLSPDALKSTLLLNWSDFNGPSAPIAIIDYMRTRALSVNIEIPPILMSLIHKFLTV